MIICIIIICIIGFYFGFPWCILKAMRYRDSLGFSRGNKIALTFDDGPSRNTDKILSLLDRYSVKATFFVTGSKVKRDVLEKIQSRGHAVASHGYDHVNHWKCFPWRAWKDIQLGFKAIEDFNNRPLDQWRLFRPPYGKVTLFTLLYLWFKRVKIVYWTFDSGDTWENIPDVDSRMEEFIQTSGTGIVLFHDLYYPDTERNNYVFELCEKVLKYVQEKQIKATAL
ncbi:MAG: polysaccharide deacetylase family protein [Sedimentisphaerales bacterium]|nr:polysaccharide deacetylase family protein [Sedimentisphaerales bacterium]